VLLPFPVFQTEQGRGKGCYFLLAGITCAVGLCKINFKKRALSKMMFNIFVLFLLLIAGQVSAYSKEEFDNSTLACSYSAS
jgi:hypothetical protein